MGRWRVAAIALAVGGIILAAGYVVPRLGETSSETTPGTEPAGTASLACPAALETACRSVAENLGVPFLRWTEGAPVPEAAVVVAAAADLPDGAPGGEVVASSPLVVGVWSDRAGVLTARCGAADLPCIAGVLGGAWNEVGGPAEWGIVKVGIPDPTRSETGLFAWSVLAGVADDDAALGRSLRLVSETDGRLTADLVLFGSSRADAVVATEAALASQLANAVGRGGRLEIVYPEASPWVDYVTSAEGRDAERLAGRLTSKEARAAMIAAGLRPADGDVAGLPDGLGVPGRRIPSPDEAARATLMTRWEDL